MRRKLVKQGNNALTVTLPKKWADEQGLIAGNEIDISEESKNLILASSTQKKIKNTNLNLDELNSNILRSTVGALYRGGYDKISVTFSKLNLLPELQKTVDSLYGYEIFDIEKTSCTIKTLFDETKLDILPYIDRMIHTINSFQNIFIEDLENKNPHSKALLYEYRMNVVKQRDIIVRIISQQILVDNKHLPYYSISYGLWNIIRNYYNLYSEFEHITSLNEEDKSYLKNTFNFFTSTFEKKEINMTKLFEQYTQNKKTGKELLKKKESNHLIASFCLNVNSIIQGLHSAIYLLRK